MTDNEQKRIIEAVLFVSDKPITIEQVKDVLEGADGREIRRLIYELREEYEKEGRSFQVTEVAGGFQVTTHSTYSPWLKKLYKNRQKNRLSRAALETLAIIAYRQPIIRAEVEAVRGVNAEGVLAALLEKGLVKITGRRETVGRPFVYGTTREFLEYFGLNSLKELPQLKEFKEEDVKLEKPVQLYQGNKNGDEKQSEN